jgi:nucleoside-diphosphate-sugar epimerase
MKVFVAGATGVLGRQLVPQLVARGHEVVGMTRSASKQELRSLGARPVVADALDPDAVAEAVASAEPEVIVHQLTALSGPLSMREARHLERSEAFIMTNRLRTEGTDHLLAAGRAVGARRFVAQSFAAWRWARTGGPVQTEADPFDPNPPAALGKVQAGYLYLEQAVTAIRGAGVAIRRLLRPGDLHQCGSGCGDGGADPQASIPDRRQRRRVFSHIHVEDAATVTTIASNAAGRIYNVVDDEPAPVREWLPILAGTLGAKPPRHASQDIAVVLDQHQSVGIPAVPQHRAVGPIDAEVCVGLKPHRT